MLAGASPELGPWLASPGEKAGVLRISPGQPILIRSASFCAPHTHRSGPGIGATGEPARSHNHPEALLPFIDSLRHVHPDRAQASGAGELAVGLLPDSRRAGEAAPTQSPPPPSARSCVEPTFHRLAGDPS